MDKDRIILVLQNLADNAVKYIPEYGKIIIDIKAVDRKKGKFFKVIVKDNEVGIPKDDQEKLFSKFFQATNAVRMQTEGTGLGLLIARNIIKKHGGEIIINSEEGKRTEAGFSLPL